MAVTRRSDKRSTVSRGWSVGDRQLTPNSPKGSSKSWPKEWRDERKRPRRFYVWSKVLINRSERFNRETASRGALEYFECGERAWNHVDHVGIIRELMEQELTEMQRRSREETIDRRVATLRAIREREEAIERALGVA